MSKVNPNNSLQLKFSSFSLKISLREALTLAVCRPVSAMISLQCILQNDFPYFKIIQALFYILTNFQGSEFYKCIVKKFPWTHVPKSAKILKFTVKL